VGGFTVGFSSPTAGTLSTSAGTQTGVVMQTVYAQCATAARFTVQNDLFEDIDNTYNAGTAVAYTYMINTKFMVFDHNTMIPGAVTPINRGFYTGRPSEDCVILKTSYFVNLSITNNISMDPGAGVIADCYTGLSPWFASPTTVNGVATNNLLAGGISGGEQTTWNTLGSSNQFPASYAAIGLLVDNKALDPMSTYFATGAGANLETCFAETAIRNGTVAATSCATVPGTGGTRISGNVRITGRAVIH